MSQTDISHYFASSFVTAPWIICLIFETPYTERTNVLNIIFMKRCCEITVKIVKIEMFTLNLFKSARTFFLFYFFSSSLFFKAFNDIYFEPGNSCLYEGIPCMKVFVCHKQTIRGTLRFLKTSRIPIG
uniref:Uncharacterized protein n=1 Tax=Cacopsylla melanoneura TaxID=428564 RepID=A0A8D8LA22_9HEMI